MPAWRHLPLVMMLLCVVQTGVTCLPTPPDTNPDNEDDPWLDIQPVAETEPNGSLAAATVVAFNDAGLARMTGVIQSVRLGSDVDYYNLGPMVAGDRLTVQIVTPDSDLKTVAAVFDADGKLFELQTYEATDEDIVDPTIDEVIRHDSSAYYLIVSQAPRTGLVGGTYEARITVERGGEVPAPQRQVVWLNFDGGTVDIPEQGTVTLGAFDPQNIDPVYAGQNAVVRDWIVRMVRQNYARYAVTVLSSDESDAPADGPYSVVYFGGYDLFGLGMAVAGTDFYNADPADVAVVFTERFTEDLFTVQPDARELGTAIGNVTAHEIGHLLGLSHVNQAYDIMNGYDAPDNLLGDQRFKDSLINMSIFPVVDLMLGQDGHLLLLETVGPAPSASDEELTVGTDPSALAVGDLDENGSADIVAACPTAQEVWVLWNDGEGGFPTHGMASGFGCTSVGIEDLDADGHPDLFGTDVANDGVFVYLNQGGGNFAEPQSYVTDIGPWAVTAGDLTGDGFPDLAVANALADNVSILANLGDGSFADNVTVSDGAFPYAITIADFNDDDWLDLVFGNTGSLMLPGGAWVLDSDGAGGFLPAVVYADLALVAGVVAADVNGDGLPDLVIADLYATPEASGAVDVLLNDGAGGFTSPVHYMAGEATSAVAVGDLDGDSRPDLVAANSGTDDVSVLFNRGDGTFEPEQPYRVGLSPAAVAIADFDGDGLADIVAANYESGTLSVLFNKGGGQFGLSVTQP